MTPEQVKGITRQFTEQSKSFVSLSTHYKKPIDAGQITHLQGIKDVLSDIERGMPNPSFIVMDECDYKTGYLDAIKHVEEFIKQLMSNQIDVNEVEDSLNQWAEQQRKTLKLYLK